MRTLGNRRSALVWGLILVGALASGCASRHAYVAPPSEPQPPVPHELAQVSLPPYVIEPPDILLIDAIRLVPRPPYRIEALDSIGIRVTDTLPDQPIQGVYAVEPDGRVPLGFDYGSVFVQGMTLEDARGAIERALRRSLNPPFKVTVVAAESRALQQIRGPHLVQPDGTVNLGLYGNVYIDGMTLPLAKDAIQNHLAQFFVKPEVSLAVSGYNSKVFYMVTDGGGVTGDQVTRLPITGKTTVLDALGLVGGLPFQASKKKIFVVRPAPAGSDMELILPVDYHGIVARGRTGTNYQLLPGDRLYVKSAPLIAADAYLARFLAPIERLMGTTLLGTSVISSFQGIAQGGAFGNNTNNNGTAAIITPIR